MGEAIPGRTLWYRTKTGDVRKGTCLAFEVISPQRVVIKISDNATGIKVLAAIPQKCAREVVAERPSIDFGFMGDKYVKYLGMNVWRADDMLLRTTLSQMI